MCVCNIEISNPCDAMVESYLIFLTEYTNSDMSLSKTLKKRQWATVKQMLSTIWSLTVKKSAKNSKNNGNSTVKLGSKMVLID